MEDTLLVDKRLTLSESKTGREKNFSSSGLLLNDTLFDCRFLHGQEKAGGSHRWPPRRGDSSSDIGGDFLLFSQKCIPGSTNVDISTNRKGYPRRTYQGPLYAWSRTYSGLSGSVGPSSNAQLDALGAKGIARALPTNPIAGMGQFLGELRDIPNLYGLETWKPRARELRNQWRKFMRKGPSHGAADAYLNTMFGWLPLISDIVDFHNAMKNANAHAEQYDRNSGRHIRRRRTINESTSTTVTDISNSAYAQPSLATPLYTSAGKLTRTVTDTTKSWFSGAFTYYLPSCKTNIGKMRYAEAQLAHTFGLRLDPYLLWQLTPWSWAADWVANAGDVIHNWSAFQNDGLVMHYGYVMEHKHRTETYALNGCALVERGPISLTQTYEYECKARRRATPYGFGLNPASFSNRQWSIIAALGISRSPRNLNF